MSFLERFQSLSTSRKLGVVLAAVLLLAVVAGGATFLWSRQSAYAVLFKDLRTMDAATIVADLDKRKVPYELRDGGATILVPAKVADATRLAVMSEDLPLKGTVGFEIFNKSDMGLTDFAQKINYRRALQGELARTIMALEGVESARVHLSLAEPSVFREDRRPSKASVTLIPRAGHVFTPGAIAGVQRLVAAAVPDLSVADVVVLDEKGDVVSVERGALGLTAPSNLQQRQAIEEVYAARIRQALQGLVAEDQLVVRVVAEPAPAAALAPASGDQALADEATAPVQDQGLSTGAPEARTFPIAITLEIAAPLGPQMLEAVRRRAGEAVGLNLPAGDTLVVQQSYAVGGVPPPVTAPSATAPSRGDGLAEAVSGARWISPVLVVVLAGLFGLALLLQRRGGRAPDQGRLAPGERQAYADRLRALLEQEGDHVQGA